MADPIPSPEPPKTPQDAPEAKTATGTPAAQQNAPAGQPEAVATPPNPPVAAKPVPLGAVAGIRAASSASRPKPQPTVKPKNGWSARKVKGLSTAVINNLQANPEIPDHWKNALVAEIASKTGANAASVDVHSFTEPKSGTFFLHVSIASSTLLV